MADPTSQPSEYTPQFWWNVIQSILTLGLGVAGWWIARRNLENADHTLRLQQYEKRYAVYQAVREFMTVIIAHAAVEDKDLDLLRVKTAEASFLFQEDVPAMLGRLRTEAIELMSAIEAMRNHGDEAAYKAAVADKWKRVKALTNEGSELHDLFKFYLYVAPPRKRKPKPKK